MVKCYKPAWSETLRREDCVWGSFFKIEDSMDVIQMMEQLEKLFKIAVSYSIDPEN